MKPWIHVALGLILATTLFAAGAPPIVEPLGPEVPLASGDTSYGHCVALDDDGNLLALFDNVFGGFIDARGGTFDVLEPAFVIGGGARGAAVDATGDGDFVISWSQMEGYELGLDETVVLERRATDGTPTGPLVTVGDQPTGMIAAETAVGTRPDSFIVAWEEFVVATTEIRARVLPFVGPPQSILQVSDSLSGSSISPRLASTADGRTLLVWRQTACGDLSDNEGGCVAARHIDAAGVPTSGNFRVNTITTGAQSFPTVAASDESFIVAWTSTDCGDSCIRARLVGGDGAPVGGDLRIDEPGADATDRAGIAATGDGDFIVSWVRREGSEDLTYARVFDPSGDPRNSEFLVNSDLTSEPYETDVAVNDNSQFVVVWGDPYNLWGRFFDLNISLFEDGFESGDTSKWDTVVQAGE